MSECLICPLWVMACVHWNGKILILASNQSHVKGCHFSEENPHFVVFQVERYNRCSTSGCDRVMGVRAGTRSDFSDLESARAKFHKRELEVLREGTI